MITESIYTAKLFNNATRNRSFFICFFELYPQNGTEKEPIKWSVIKKEGNIVTLIADRILTNFMYDRYYSDYKNSALNFRVTVGHDIGIVPAIRLKVEG